MSWNLNGHEWAEKLLKKHIANNEVRHAYLFTGAIGTGRRSLAMAFACAINCLEPPAPGEFCGKCRMCRQLQKMQQPDLTVVQAETDGGMIKVEQVRSLEHSLSLSPYEAKYRVALLLDFQQANANSQNALLKTLEEAPQKVILLLTADSAENLLPTIASRCEILRLHPIAVDALEIALETRWQVSRDNARLYSHLANGRVGTAVRYSQQPELLENRVSLLDDLDRLFSSSLRDRLAYVEKLSRDRDAAREALRVWFTCFRDLMLLVNGSGAEITNLDREAELKSLAAKIPPATILQMVNAMDRATVALEANGHLRLLLDNFFLELPRIE